MVGLHNALLCHSAAAEGGRAASPKGPLWLWHREWLTAGAGRPKPLRSAFPSRQLISELQGMQARYLSNSGPSHGFSATLHSPRSLARKVHGAPSPRPLGAVLPSYFTSISHCAHPIHCSLCSGRRAVLLGGLSRFVSSAVGFTPSFLQMGRDKGQASKSNSGTKGSAPATKTNKENGAALPITHCGLCRQAGGEARSRFMIAVGAARLRGCTTLSCGSSAQWSLPPAWCSAQWSLPPAWCSAHCLSLRSRALQKGGGCG